MNSFLRTIEKSQRAALQRYGLKTVVDVAPEDDVVTLAEARAHLRVDAYGSPPESADDDWIEAQIPAARAYCEGYLGRALAPRTMELATNAFPGVSVVSPPGACFTLPFGPVVSVEWVRYIDSDGVEQTLDSAGYEVDAYAHPSRVVLTYGSTWPAARNSLNSVRVRYVTGYVAASESPGTHPVIPKTARAAVLLMLGHLYENREASGTDKLLELPLGVSALLDVVPWREEMGFA